MPNETWTFDGDAEQDSTAFEEGGIANTDTSRGTLHQGYDYGSVTSGLVAYYPMEFGDFDTSWDAALDNHGSINGATWTSTTQVGDWALSFNNNNNDTVNIGLSPANELTFCMWVKTSSSSSRDFAMGVGDQTGGNNLWIGVNDGEYFSRTCGSNSLGDPTATVGDGTWKFIATTVASDGTVIDYVDGTNVYSYSVTTDFSNVQNEPAQIGNRGDSYSGRYWDGDIAEARIYDRTLSGSEIESLYNLTAPSGSIASTDPRSNLIHEYKLDGDATDSVGTADGTNNGVTFVNGYEGKAGDFDGTDDISLPDASSWDVQNITITAWSKSRNTATYQSQFARYGDDSTIWELQQKDTGSYRFIIYDDSANLYIISGGDVTDSWQFIVATYDGSSIRLYVNGKIVASSSESFTMNTGTQNPAIGAEPNGGNEWDGLIDEVRFYDRALDPIEVQQLFELGRYRINDGDTLQ